MVGQDFYCILKLFKYIKIKPTSTAAMVFNFSHHHKTSYTVYMINDYFLFY